jgi:chitinase
MAHGSGSNDSAPNASIFLAAAHSIRNTTQAQRKFPGKTGASHLSPAGNQDGNLPAHVLVGYLHNFDNGAARVRVATVSPDFDVINIAFATAAPGSTSRIEFSVDPVLGTPTQFQSEVRSAQGQGKIANLSIGGANSPVLLNNDTDLANFVTSVSSLVQNYGFNGIDIDFEGNSLILNPGDTDFRNPTTPSVVNLISALHQLKAQFGPDFVISMAPETLFVQAGIVAYGGPYGAYLPVIYGTQDILSYVHVQDYNSGPMQALDGRIYTQGNADFHVAMTEMLLQGFPIAGDPNRVFPPLPPEQVAFGVPASPRAGQGYTPPGDLEKALDYLINHNSFGGSYQLMDPLGYSNMLGMMTWSINWDASNGFQVSRRISQFLHGLP